MTQRKILTAAAVAGSCLAVGKAAGALREVLVLRALGAGNDADAYVLGLVLATALGATAAGGMSTAVTAVPDASRTRQGPFQRLVSSLCVALAVAGAVHGSIRDGGGWFLLGLAPLVIFFGLTALPTARLIEDNRSIRFAALSTLHPVVSFIGVWVAVNDNPTAAILAAHLLGAVVMWAGLHIASRRQAARPYALRELSIPEFWPYLLIGYLAYANPVTDRIVTQFLPDGSAALLAAAESLLGMLSGTVGVALANSYYPRFIESRGLKGPLYSALPRVLGAGFVLGVALALTVPYAVDLAFPGFSGQQRGLLLDCVRVLSVSVPLLLAVQVVLKWIYANNGVSVVRWVALCLIPANLGLDLLLIPRFGLVGVALGSTVVAAAQLLLLGRAVRRMTRHA